MRRGRLPNLVVIGAPKCGTTSLHHYLSLHPEISMSREKELNFFQVEGNWSKGRDWYVRQFRGAAPVCGESSPQYTNCLQYAGVPERMHSLLPEAKLIYLLRDPIERVLSHYVHRVAQGREKKTLEESVWTAGSPSAYASCSKYHMQLERYLPFYSLSDILILTAEELRVARRSSL